MIHLCFHFVRPRPTLQKIFAANSTTKEDIFTLESTEFDHTHIMKTDYKNDRGISYTQITHSKCHCYWNCFLISQVDCISLA